MRGLTSTGGESPTVGFYLDETALTPPAMAQNGKVVIDPSLFDLNRVEILRGPQGTLYGSGSMGGTIKLVTNQPDTKNFSANVEGIGSGTDGGGFNHTENGMINIPLVQDLAALRLVVTDKYVQGWIDSGRGEPVSARDQQQHDARQCRGSAVLPRAFGNPTGKPCAAAAHRFW